MTAEDQMLEAMAQGAFESDGDSWDAACVTQDDKAWRRRAAVAALAALRQAETVSGWRLVPVEPTEGMWTAGRHPIMARDLGVSKEALAAGNGDYLDADTWYRAELDGRTQQGMPAKGDTAVWVWRAMIAASPKPPAAE